MQARPRAFEEELAVDAAMRLFWRQGYHATSAADLVEATQLSRSSLYGAFKDKRGILESALQRYRQAQSAGLVELLAENGPLRPRLALILHHTVEMSAAGPCAGCLMVNTAVEFGSTDEGIRDIVRANVTEVEQALAKAIARAKASGDFSSKKSARKLARYFFHQLTALRVTAKVIDDPEFFSDAIEVAMSAFD